MKEIPIETIIAIANQYRFMYSCSDVATIDKDRYKKQWDFWNKEFEIRTVALKTTT